ncbi:MAG TPA: hypothetical protein VFS21_24380 [Roseiflexaceae bacterium]|nr:hypothetical protein [Roseiflexaceae bacterium]
MSDPHSWVLEFHRQAASSEDPRQRRIALLLHRFWLYGGKDHDSDLAGLAEIRGLADQIGEGRVALFADHWRAQWLLHRKRDYGAARDVVVPAIVEVRKPEYRQLPQRVCLHEDAIQTYIGMDVYGYAPSIEQALAYMDAEIAPNVECRLCHCGMWLDYALETNRLDLADEWAQRYLALSQSPGLASEHHETYAHQYLAFIAARREQWDTVLERAAAGIELARRTDQPAVQADLMAYQALATLRLGKTNEARRLLWAALKQARQVDRVLDHSFYNPCCTFYELDGQPELALGLRREELGTLVGSGKNISECRCRVEICRLLKLLGQPYEHELAAAREAAARLADPSRIRFE